jgi:hypothetical protein
MQLHGNEVLTLWASQTLKAGYGSGRVSRARTIRWQSADVASSGASPEQHVRRYLQHNHVVTAGGRPPRVHNPHRVGPERAFRIDGVDHLISVPSSEPEHRGRDR